MGMHEVSCTQTQAFWRSSRRESHRWTRGGGTNAACLSDPKWKFGLTRLLHLALLSRFTRMSQLRPGEINF